MEKNTKEVVNRKELYHCYGYCVERKKALAIKDDYGRAEVLQEMHFGVCNGCRDKYLTEEEIQEQLIEAEKAKWEDSDVDDCAPDPFFLILEGMQKESVQNL